MRGIMFIELLFGRTIEGFKDMTRRSGGLELLNGTKKDPLEPEEYFFLEDTINHFDRKGQFRPCFRHKKGKKNDIACYSYYRKGEYLYIKEPTIVYPDGKILYKYKPTEAQSMKWDNKMYMGADRARYYVQITDIKVERFNDITTADCIREGVIPGILEHLNERDRFFSIYRVANNIPSSKELKNIWVFVYTFRFITDTEEITKIKQNGSK